MHVFPIFPLLPDTLPLTGYGTPNEDGMAAVKLLAQLEGILLDPVYTGKAFAGVIKLAREGKFRPTDNVLFLYSGGAGGLRRGAPARGLHGDGHF